MSILRKLKQKLHFHKFLYSAVKKKKAPFFIAFLFLFLSGLHSLAQIAKDVEITGKIGTAPPPEKPTLSLSTGCNGDDNPYIQLTWSATANTNFYDIYRNSAVLATNVTAISYQDSNVENSTTYSYYVVAHGPGGSTASNSSSIKASNCEVPKVQITTFEGDPVSGTPRTTDNTPEFSGNTNIENANIKIEIKRNGEVIYTGYTTANINGYWSFQVPVTLGEDQYELLVTASDPNDPSIFATASLNFEIVAEEEEEGGGGAKPATPQTPTPEGGPTGEPPTSGEPAVGEIPAVTPPEAPTLPAEGEFPIGKEQEMFKEGKNLLKEITNALGIDTLYGFVEQSIPFIGDFLKKHPVLAATGKAMGLALPALPIILELGSLKDFLTLFKETLARLFGILFWRRKYAGWGIVYDIQDGKPLPLSYVNIYNERGKLMETKVTDNLGIYFFLVKPGKYVIEVIKKGYKQVTWQSSLRGNVFYQGNYLGGEIDIKDPDLVDANIPMQRGEMSRFKLIISSNFFHRLFIAFYWLMFVVNIFVYMVDPSLFNAVIIFLYLLLAVLLNFTAEHKKWGIVIDESSKPQIFARVEAYSNATQSIVAQTLTDQYGRYLFILKPGNYTLQVRDREGFSKATKFIKLNKMNAVHEEIILK